MKILSCYIENFGKLHEYAVNFSEGVNVFCAENGWGKSTFAAFIRAMFYGLEGERKRSLEENERKKYRPWQGGIFGGRLIFETKGKMYQILRIFHEKEANDEFELRDAKTNLISKDYSKKIGEELFKINRESFLRTVFFGQDLRETYVTDDINARLGTLSEGGSDLRQFDAAYERLTKVINSMNPTRSTGSIAKREEEIAKLEQKFRMGQELSKSVEQYQEYVEAEEVKYALLKEKIKEIRELQEKASKVSALWIKKSEWEQLKKIATLKKEEAERQSEKFPGDIPSLEEIRSIIEEYSELERALERKTMYGMKEEEQEVYRELAAMFGHGIPGKETIEEILEEVGMLHQLNRQVQTVCMSPEEEKKLKELESCFAYEENDLIFMILHQWKNRNSRKDAISKNQAALTRLKTVEPNRKSHVLWCGAGVLVAGVITAITILPFVGGILMLAGILLLLADFFMKKKDLKESQKRTAAEVKFLEQTIKEDMEVVQKAEEEVATYLKVHGKILDEQRVETMLQEIMAESAEYTSLKKKKHSFGQDILMSELEKKKQHITQFLQQYGIRPSGFDFSEEFFRLKSNIEKYTAFQKQKEKLTAEEKFCKIKEKQIGEFFERYHLEPEPNLLWQLNEIQEAVYRYQEAVKSYADALDDLSIFEAKENLAVLKENTNQTDIYSPEQQNDIMLEITQEMEEVHSAIINYNKVLEELAEKYEEWEECKDKLQELKQQQEEEKKKYDHICMARAKLVLAKETLTAQYADPMLEGFGKYFELLAQTSSERFYIDANTVVTVEEQGKQREINMLSAGYQDLVALCFRAALLEAMYREDLPMLILDDPLINLDDKKIEAGKKFLEELSKKYQIIYFTCSTVRSLPDSNRAEG